MRTTDTLEILMFLEMLDLLDFEPMVNLIYFVKESKRTLKAETPNEPMVATDYLGPYFRLTFASKINCEDGYESREVLLNILRKNKNYLLWEASNINQNMLIYFSCPPHFL